MNAALLAALINEVALPELTVWLRSLHAQGKTVSDVEVVQKLVSDTTLGVSLGEAWLKAHPAP